MRLADMMATEALRFARMQTPNSGFNCQRPEANGAALTVSICAPLRSGSCYRCERGGSSILVEKKRPHAPQRESRTATQRPPGIIGHGVAASVGRDGIDPATVAIPDHYLNPEEAFAEAELLDRVRQAVEQLPEDYACVIRYYYFENLSLEVIAQKLDISVSWACRVHARAITMLNKFLKNCG